MDHKMNEKEKVSTNRPAQSQPHPGHSQALQPALQHSACSQWRPLAHTNLLPDWRLLSLEGHSLMWEAASRSHPSAAPPTPAPQRLPLSFLFLLRAPRLRQSSLIGNRHLQTRHPTWTQQLGDSHICLCPEHKGPSAPFLPGTQTPAEGKTYQAGKLWLGACTNMMNVKEE